MITLTRITAEYFFQSRNSRKREFLFILKILAEQTRMKEYLVNTRFCTAAINTFFSLENKKAFKNIIHSINQVSEKKMIAFNTKYLLESELLAAFDSHLAKMIETMSREPSKPIQLSLQKLGIQESIGENSVDFIEKANQMDIWLKQVNESKIKKFRGLNRTRITEEE